MPFEILHFRESDRILQEKNLEREFKPQCNIWMMFSMVHYTGENYSGMAFKKWAGEIMGV